MIEELDIRGRLAAVAAGELPLWKFYDWLEFASLNMHKDSADVAMELVGEIDLIFADFDAGLIKQDELRRQIVALANPAFILSSQAPEPIGVNAGQFVRTGSPLFALAATQA
jgi:hypothetical protein